MDLSGLAEVRRLLHEAPQFSAVWDYFLTHFGEVPEFMRLGDPVAQDEVMQQVIVEVCKSLFVGKSAVLMTARLVRIPEHRFIHGSLTLDGHLGSILYFEDIHKGMLSLVWSVSPPETKYVRFTGRALYEALTRSTN